MNKVNHFFNMNEEQKEVIFKLSKLKSASATQVKMAHIIKTEENCGCWEYDGFIDTGVLGGDHCSMGHALRYVHFARNVNTDETIKFGIKCISDFFNITPEELKLIQLGFVFTNRFINDIISRFNSPNCLSLVKEYKDKVNSIKEKPEHIDSINELLNVSLPLPLTYEIEVNTIYKKEQAEIEFNEFLDNNPDYCSLVVMAQLVVDDSSFENKHPGVYDKISGIMKYLKDKRKLSEAQINLLKKLLLHDFSKTDEIVDDLTMIDRNDFLNRGRMNDYELFNSLKSQYEDWGLSEKQLALLDKIYKKNKPTIDKIKNEELLLAE